MPFHVTVSDKNKLYLHCSSTIQCRKCWKITLEFCKRPRKFQPSLTRTDFRFPSKFEFRGSTVYETISRHNILIIINGEQVKRGRTRKKKNKERIKKDKKRFISHSSQGSKGDAVVRALTSHKCGPGSNPGVDAICGLSLLLVLSLAPRGFSPGTPVFPSP